LNAAFAEIEHCEFYTGYTVSLKRPPTPLGIEVIGGRRNISKLLTFKDKLQISRLFQY